MHADCIYQRITHDQKKLASVWLHRYRLQLDDFLHFFHCLSFYFYISFSVGFLFFFSHFITQVFTFPFYREMAGFFTFSMTFERKKIVWLLISPRLLKILQIYLIWIIFTVVSPFFRFTVFTFFIQNLMVFNYAADSFQVFYMAFTQFFNLTLLFNISFIFTRSGPTF